MARSLDLLPYAYITAHVMQSTARKSGDLRIFDAFGGSGFLSRSFAHTDIRFTIADCTDAYDHDSCTRHEWLLSQDYFRSISVERAGTYDLVFAHGGLHHVYVEDETGIQDETSIGLQNQCVANMARLLRPGGYLVLSDIPDRPPAPHRAGKDFVLADLKECLALLGEERLDFLKSSAPSFSPVPSLNKTCASVNFLFRDPSHDGSLRRFFDEVVARETPNGHEARFLDVERIITGARAHGMSVIYSAAFPGAWVFRDRDQAVWYFREMFGFGASVPAFGRGPEDSVVESAMTNILGLRSLGKKIAVNWGVTYTIFARK